MYALAPEVKSNQKPNILAMWGDDIGTWNINYWNRGLMGYETFRLLHYWAVKFTHPSEGNQTI
ncbi:hypothetical protein TUM4249_12470 [Shewanella sp. KT0246]|nr:hypothetical protein TUM4249_12470 [Shewanella sp. KT0246]